VDEPTVSRPDMPGYGVLSASEGRGLLPWAWATARLVDSHDYWLATTWPDGRPHVMPVWGLWHAESFWFSSSGRSRKTLNLAANPRCVVTTDNPREPVIVEGIAERVTDLATLATILELENSKYATTYTMELFDPQINACFRVRPRWAFGIAEGGFTDSPTRWTFADSTASPIG
jgi:general stress protein 26